MTRWLSPVACWLILVSLAAACPFCEAPDVTLTQQLQQSDVAVLVQWVAAKPADRETSFPGETTYEVIDVIHDSSGTLKKGKTITVDRHRAGNRGELFVMLGSLSTIIEWGSPLEVTETSYNYMTQAPSSEAERSERLRYFVRFLEYPDKLIANDAYAEFAGSPYSDVVKIVDDMPRENLVKWITDPNTPQNRLGLYGLMLGLCGKESDAQLMEAKILESTTDYRIGIDGIMAGYIMLKGEKALDTLDREKLQDKSEPFSEHVAVMQALRFLWTDAPEYVPAERLRKSMRLMLDTDVADLAINDLARWEDWSITADLAKRYGTDKYDKSFIKRNILRFMMAAVDSVPKDAESQPEYAKTAQAFLDRIKAEDPDLFKAAERFYFR